jgi:hypothetical protein
MHTQLPPTAARATARAPRGDSKRAKAQAQRKAQEPYVGVRRVVGLGPRERAQRDRQRRRADLARARDLNDLVALVHQRSRVVACSRADRERLARAQRRREDAKDDLLSAMEHSTKPGSVGGMLISPCQAPCARFGYCTAPLFRPLLTTAALAMAASRATARVAAAPTNEAQRQLTTRKTATQMQNTTNADRSGQGVAWRHGQTQ